MGFWSCFFFVLLFACKSYELFRPNSPLCEEGKHAVKGGLVEVSTLMDADCDDLSLEVIDGSPLADVELSEYQFRGRIRWYPKLNISFSNIRFLSMMLRLKVGGGNVTVCKNFTVNAVAEPISFFWDCSWFTYEFRGYPMTVECLSTDKNSFDYKKFSFQLPKSGLETTNPLDMELFVYREELPECVKIHVGKPADSMKFLGYRFTLHEYGVGVHTTFDTNLTELTYCGLPKLHSLYNVSVQPKICVQDECSWGRASFSQPFYSSPLQSNTYLELTGLIITLLILILLIMYCSWHIFKIYLSRQVSASNRCILVYEPSSQAHLTVVRQFTDFLRSIEETVLFGEMDIGLENGSDWWPRELKKANVVIILSNPTPKQTEDMYKSSIHASLFKAGVVKQHLRNLYAWSSSGSKRFVKILLPYCQEEDFYDFTSSLQCYHIFKDRYKILQEIQGIPSMCITQCILWRLYSSVFKSHHWSKLKSAISAYGDIHTQEISSCLNYNGSADEKSQLSFHNYESTSSGSEDEVECSDSEHRHIDLEMVKDNDSSDAESVDSLRVKGNGAMNEKGVNETGSQTLSTDVSVEISAVDFGENFKHMCYKFLARPNT